MTTVLLVLAGVVVCFALVRWLRGKDLDRSSALLCWLELSGMLDLFEKDPRFLRSDLLMVLPVLESADQRNVRWGISLPKLTLRAWRLIEEG